MCYIKAINNTTIKSYGSRELQLQIADATGALCTHMEQVELVNIIEYDFILGFPWLERVDPDMQWST